MIKTRLNKEADEWNYAMIFKGLIGGIGAIITGIFIILNGD